MESQRRGRQRKGKGSTVLGMIRLDVDIWRAAKALIDLHGEGAALCAAQCVAALLNEGDPAGAVIWSRVHAAIEEWQRRRRKGEPIN